MPRLDLAEIARSRRRTDEAIEFAERAVALRQEARPKVRAEARFTLAQAVNSERERKGRP